VFSSLTSGHGLTVGSERGFSVRHGYIAINISGVRFFAHRLAFLFMTGEWPKDDVDHINGIKTDNCISNLRLATICQNTAYHLGDSERRNIVRDGNKFRVEMIVHGVRYRRRAATLEKAIAVREEMYARFPALAAR
jgi:hypothetical protein